MARRDTNFYYSFVVLPARQRRAIVAVWEFCRAVDDAVDENGGEMGELSAWREELAACFDGQPIRTREARNLEPHIRAFKLTRRHFEAVIDGVEMDLHRLRYETFDELHEYCLRVASAVGLICIEIFGYRHPASRQYAIDLGVALQLTNILRDLGRDLAMGRIYLPLEDLRRYGVTEDDLRAGVVTQNMRNLLTHQAERARGYYQRAAETLPKSDARRLVAAQIMGAIYYDLLRRIERSGYDVFSTTIRAPRPAKALIAARTWARTMAGI